MQHLTHFSLIPTLADMPLTLRPQGMNQGHTTQVAVKRKLFSCFQW